MYWIRNKIGDDRENPWFRTRRAPGLRVALARFGWALAVLVTGSAAASDHFIVNPMVTRITADSATLIWVSKPVTGADEVVVSTWHGDAKQRVSSRPSVPPFIDGKPAGLKHDYVRHTATIKGLRPATRYQYQVTSAQDDSTSTGEFGTAPMPGAQTAFSFCVISDAHNTHSTAAQTLSQRNPAFIVIDGDFIDDNGAKWNNWIKFFDSARPYTQKTPIVPVMGGHDIAPADNFRALFALDEPGEMFPNTQACYYTTVYGNVRSIVLDTYVDDSAMAGQLQWLEQVLKKNTSEWTLAYFHEPVFAAGSRGIMDDTSRLVDLFERYGVDIVVCGHNHIYERMLPIGPKGKKPVHYVTINTNGGKFRVLRPSPVVVGGIGKQIKCFAEFQVKGNELSMIIRSVDGGNPIDRLDLVKRNGTYQASVNAQAITKELARRIAHVYARGGKPESMYVRNDIPIELSGRPEPNVPLKATLDTSTFPAGSRLHVLSGTDSRSWRAKPKVGTVNGAETALELIPPSDLKIRPDGSMKPTITLNLNFEYQQRRFHEVTVTPTWGPKTEALLKTPVAP